MYLIFRHLSVSCPSTPQSYSVTVIVRAWMPSRHSAISSSLHGWSPGDQKYLKKKVLMKLKNVWKEQINSTTANTYRVFHSKANKVIGVIGGDEGQLISKCLFSVLKFFQKMNENKLTWGIIVIVKSNLFFGRNVVVKKIE